VISAHATVWTECGYRFLCVTCEQANVECIVYNNSGFHEFGLRIS